MEKNSGDSNRITRKYMDSLLIETRYMNSACPDLTMQLYGRKFSSPIMTAALSHLDHFMFEGAILAVGIDIDHPFAEDGSPDVVDGYEMTPVRTQEMKEICESTDLPVIVKGVLSVYDANEAVTAGARGLVLSHHNNRIEYAIPPLMALPEIKKNLKKQVPVFVDCEIQSGIDAFKALALGADGVIIARPYVTAVYGGAQEGIAALTEKLGKELADTMKMCGTPSLSAITRENVRL